METLPSGLRLRPRAAVSGRARAALPPNLQRYADTGEALIAEPLRGVTADGTAVAGLVPHHPASTTPEADHRH